MKESRVIKFRAWEERSKTMHYNLSWYSDNGGAVMAQERPLINALLLQFTGLHDKHGVEIYEGDVCRVLYTDWPSKSNDDPRTLDQYLKDISRLASVEFVAFEWCFNFGKNRFGEFEYGSFIVGIYGKIEVIGNIYQNPELL